MAQIHHRANLSYSTFPIKAEDQGRTVIVDKLDNIKYIGGGGSNELGERNEFKGTPSVMYMHNAMPTERGFQSIGYEKRVNMADDGSSLWFGAIYPVIRGQVYIGYEYTTRQIYKNLANNAWSLSQLPDLAAAAPVDSFTLATINGNTYMLRRRAKCYKWDTGTNAFIVQALSGVTVANIDGMIESNGYGILWTETDILWSSAITPVDYVPSLITGAGGGALQEARGKILFCSPMPGGFMVFCEFGSVLAYYTGNARYPFSFRTVDGAGGFTYADNVKTSSSDVDYNAYVRNLGIGIDSGFTHAWNTSGIQEYAQFKATTTLGEVSDYIEGERFEDFDESGNNLMYVYKNREATSAQQAINGRKLSLIGNRYLVISYNASNQTFNLERPLFTHALVFDLTLRKWGKLKINHTWCFEYAVDGTNTYWREKPRRSIGFLLNTGEIRVVNFDTQSENNPSSGIIILGRFQYVSDRLLILDHVIAEKSYDQSALEILDLYYIDGVEGLQLDNTEYTESTGRQRISNFDREATSHSIVFKGNFDLSSVTVVFHLGGHL